MSLDIYCQQIVPHDTKADQISDTVEFRHQTITTPVLTPEDRILPGITTLMDALTDAPTAQSDTQLQATIALRDASNGWASPNYIPDSDVPILRPTPAQTRRAMKILERKLNQPPITRHPTPRVPKKPAICEPDPRRKTPKKYWRYLQE